MKHIYKVIIAILAVFCIGAVSWAFLTNNSAESVAAEASPRQIEIPVLNEDAIVVEWYKQHLSEDEVQLYEAIEQSILTLNRDVSVSNMDSETVSKCFWDVIYDHPEYFWVDNSYNYFYDVDGTVSTFQMNFIIDDFDEIESKLHDYEVIAGTVLTGTPGSKNDPDLIQQAYTWVCYSSRYKGNDTDQSMMSIFDDHESVCAGYVQAFRFILSQAGIPSVRVAGQSVDDEGNIEDRSHTWVAIPSNGLVYMYDITWDENMFSMETTHYFAKRFNEFYERHATSDPAAPKATDAAAIREAAIKCIDGSRTSAWTPSKTR